MAELKNPNQDPDAHKRLIIVFALTFLAIIISQQLMERFGPKPAAKSEAPAVAQVTTSTPASPAQSNAPAVTSPSKHPAVLASTANSAGASTVSKQAAAESETIVENDLYRITISNRGAVVKSWILKQHKDNQEKPLDMVHAQAAQEYGYPLSLFTYDESLRNKLNQALYVPSATGTSQAPASLTFEYADGETSVRKSFHFDHSFVVKVESEVTDKGVPVSAYPAWPAGLGDQQNAPGYGSGRMDWYSGDKIERKSAKEGFFLTGTHSVSNGNTVAGPFYWAGISDQFFSAVFLPDDPANASLIQYHNVIPQDLSEKDAAKQKKNVYSVLGIALGTPAKPSNVRLFVGPKQLETLQSIHSYAPGGNPSAEPNGPDLEGLVDFGFFGFIAKPLFLWLKWTHDHWVGNWGAAIVLLTIIINLALFPLRYTSMKSALMQQKIAPELKAINYKYKDVKSLTDPRQQEKQREIQAVMKREGINPISGCIPMLIQLPFLFAFYAMLAAANELRHANFLWLKDLSAPDPIYILPISIVVSMYIMQKITPMSGMDPAQAKMMQTMMPLMIGFISFSLPAGLGVYWVTGNLIGFALQYAMNNTKTAREIREHLAKRDAKRKK